LAFPGTVPSAAFQQNVTTSQNEKLILSQIGNSVETSEHFNVTSSYMADDIMLRVFVDGRKVLHK
jgi:hypothetical protein